ncbi:MAG: hydroxylamine reductase [Methanobrevibacter sp.]|nr:hydroxylamine reductase [Methanobrevibacter sp.]
MASCYNFYRWKNFRLMEDNEMDNKMFCFQCEQTAGCQACTGAQGVCGKKADTAKLQDELTGALIGLARATEGNEHLVNETTDKLILEGLFSTITNVNFNNETLMTLIDRVELEKERLVPKCFECASACGRNDNFDMQSLWQADEDIRSLKSLILFGIRGVAAYAYHAEVLGYADKEVNNFFYKALFAIGMRDWGMEELLPIVLQVGEINLKCMALLDKANTETYGNPEPTSVPLTVEKGPFIVISGHDLYDLKQLLEQTKDRGINVYTHGEMLPAHAYPELKKYTHLKGNFGTAWQNQQKEFANIPAPILFTTNCLMPPKESYSDRVFTTEVVSYPEIVHVGEDKDFTSVIEKALELGGYEENMLFTGINGGSMVMTGFGHNAVLANAGTVVEAVKTGAIKHFFLVGGCDGARPGRNYYTEFVKQTPEDSIVLTLACGKYRFNDLDLGTIGGLPRIMDMGQCNDAYSAIKVAVALAEAFECGVNDLPLSMVLSWYEQKAVCILLTLLHLGIKNILLGPSLPAFISPNVLDFLVKNYNIAPISTPEDDMKKLIGE